MRYNGFVKSIAFILAAITLALAVCSGAGIVFSVGAGLYGQNYDSWYKEYREEEAERLATALAESYATRSLGGFTRQEQQTIGWGNDPRDIGMWRDLTEGSWCYVIIKGNLVCETSFEKSFEGQEKYRFTMTVQYPKKATANEEWDRSYYIYSNHSNEGEWSAEPTVAYDNERCVYTRMEESPEYAVTVYFKEDAITRYNNISLQVCRLLIQMQYILVGVLAGSILVAALCLLWLLRMAGKTEKASPVRPGGLNRLPLDLYGAALAGSCAVLLTYAVELTEEILYRAPFADPLWLILVALMVLGAALCVTAFLFALTAQGKQGIRAVWERSVIGWCCGKLWLVLRWCFKALCKLFGLLPIIWRYLLVAAAMAVIPAFLGLLCIAGHGIVRGFWMLVFFGSICADVGIVLYGAYAFGTLLRGAEKLASGALQTKVSTAFLIGAYRKCGEDLNALGEVSLVAAEKQLKSERMKAELITNVSHDIKTPLTSVINYIDLLQKAENDAQREEYLQVLDRQSQRLKKLIDDLMDMSKASTGNLPVEVTTLDAVEVINQALGEFSDKMAAQSLSVVFTPPAGPVPVQADGKLTWRVMSNILSNVVKYALPGTRVYVDVQQGEDTVSVSFKNISGEPLNVSAQELMERFVRGDASRNTEGSGLGLNIAQSLMQLQKGSLQLVVDGDLFKTILTFPAK